MHETTQQTNGYGEASTSSSSSDVEAMRSVDSGIAPRIHAWDRSSFKTQENHQFGGLSGSWTMGCLLGKCALAVLSPQTVPYCQFSRDSTMNEEPGYPMQPGLELTTEIEHQASGTLFSSFDSQIVQGLQGWHWGAVSV
ncbi:hypothetical protein N7530_003873 [Penicillium desertorum]|uniref:Uncharacterized protein n=1 Tax=Penicillium desertorum TaxID=1303715 RepID=A0A9W9WX84_9EURO|nr:hypothetical protein N7530_003873 [Penicillium desertorum]